MKKKEIIFACLLTVLVCIFVTRFPKLSPKQNESLSAIVMPSPPETIVISDEESVMSIINTINDCEKYFSGFSFASGWLINIRYMNRSYFLINKTSIRCGIRVWRIDIDTYNKLYNQIQSAY